MDGLTLPQDNLIILPESVYSDAAVGKHRARFTVGHEVSHYILTANGGIALARTSCHIPAYRKPEWQANTLTSEIFIPPRLSVGMSEETISVTFGVSPKAARIHLNMKAKGGLP